MNQNWTQFLQSRQAIFDNDLHTTDAPESDQRIYPVPHLSVLTVAGKDAADLLQGQMTCNVNDVSETQGSLGAFCNPKGRVIATFILVRTRDAYLLVLPCDLLQTVKTRLQKYVLRSDVRFTDSSDELCLIGVREGIGHPMPLFATRRQDVISVNLSLTKNRYLAIARPDQAVAFWEDKVNHQGFRTGSSKQWRFLDLMAGIPWINAATSEEFIPQMLNLDRLGGISFNKGCYTGQEIVARTHYLGKTKRALFLARCAGISAPEPNAAVIDRSGEPPLAAGNVVEAVCDGSQCTMQIVLQLSDNGRHEVSLQDHPEIKLQMIPFLP
ncbi:MAG: CAF17-like 4Fe-4S cluster assembly/insertion protein YgfZ [Gammaproteobacteria bacterium]